MALIQCDKCSEMVDEAKAFCPACGNAFVEEEQRSVTTNFEEMDMTVQLGQTMYNQMLSDMGLNVSKKPEARETVLKPSPSPSPTAPISEKPVPTRSGKRNLWIIVGLIAGFILIGLIVVVVAAGVILYLSPRTT